MHRLVISQALAVIGGLELAHVLELPAIRLMALQAGVHAQSAAVAGAVVRGRVRRMVVTHVLIAHHSARKLAHAALRVQGASGALGTDKHMAGALRCFVLLVLVVLLQLRRRLLLQLQLKLKQLV